jgi:hypothetical protein
MSMVCRGSLGGCPDPCAQWVDNIYRTAGYTISVHTIGYIFFVTF